MSQMLVPTIVMAVLAIALVTVGLLRGEGEHVAGLKAGGVMTLQVLPLLLFAFVAAGMVRSLVPGDAVARWLGAGSGFRGIWLGTLAGALIPGGPYVSFPVAAGLLRAGAGVGTLVAFLAAWSVVSAARLPMEVGLLGWRFTGIRLACTFFVPPLAGWLAQTVFRGFGAVGGAPHN
jgi:uncharacterized membrane protein YraQ (UPF0718 family)